MAGPRNIPRSPITKTLVEPFVLLLNELDLEPGVRLKLEKAYEGSVGQQVLLNDKLEAIMSQLAVTEGGGDDPDGLKLTSEEPFPDYRLPETGGSLRAAHADHRHPGGVVGPAGYATGVLTFTGDVGQVGTVFEFGGNAGTSATIYELGIVGPDISISGTAFLPITYAVVIPEQHTGSLMLTWLWSAGNSGVDAQWRLRNATTSAILMSGSQAAPFARALVMSTMPPGAMPNAGDEVALEVCFSGAGGDASGEIELLGPVTWEVA